MLGLCTSCRSRMRWVTTYTVPSAIAHPNTSVPVQVVFRALGRRKAFALAVVVTRFPREKGAIMTCGRGELVRCPECLHVVYKRRRRSVRKSAAAMNNRSAISMAAACQSAVVLRGRGLAAQDRIGFAV